MPILFMDGFDHYATADIGKKWTIAGGNAAVSTVYAVPNGNGQGITSTSGTTNVQKVLPSTYVTGVMGCYFTYNISGAAQTMLVFQDGGAEQCSVRIDSTSHILVSRNGTALATSTNTLTVGASYHIEFKAKINNSTGQYEVRVNGSSTNWIPQSSADKNTRAQTNNYFSGVSLNLPGGTFYYDDFYVLNCDTTPNNDFLGPQKILTCYPRKPGNYTQWTPNYLDNFMNISEDLGDSNTTFNQSSTANQIDTFTVTALPNATIAGIQHVLMAKQDTGSGRTIAALERGENTTDYAATTQSLTASYVFYCDPKDTDPAISPAAAFTYAHFNAEEFGYKILS